jgi:hypothetical protein
MTQRTVATLAAIAAGLVLLLVVVRNVNMDGGVVTGRLLLPDFAPLANDIREVRITGADDGSGVTLEREDDGWVVVERSEYPADMGKLRPLVVALSEAGIVEEKTSNPEYYDRLGLGDPESGGNGTRVKVSGEGVESTVIFGTTAQGENRYARLADEPASFLVNVNPELPQSPDDWLDPQILDIAADSVRLVTIEHPDGERIELARPDDATTADFIVVNLPEGRELSYPSVATGIGGALDPLELVAVRPRSDAAAGTSAYFTTASGLELRVDLIEEGDEEETSDSATWLRFSVGANGEETRAEAEALNARLGNWEYRVADHKTQLLTRRWDDLLAPTEEP